MARIAHAPKEKGQRQLVFGKILQVDGLGFDLLVPEQRVTVVVSEMIFVDMKSVGAKL